jgi:hypothetical protein
MLSSIVSLEWLLLLEVMFGSAVKFRALRAPTPKAPPLDLTSWTSSKSSKHSNLTSLAFCISPHCLVVVCSIPLASSKIKTSKACCVSPQSQPTAGEVGDKSNTESMPVPSQGMTFSPSVVLSWFSLLLCSGLKVVALP